jgi:hypothetical protein
MELLVSQQFEAIKTVKTGAIKPAHQTKQLSGAILAMFLDEFAC